MHWPRCCLQHQVGTVWRAVLETPLRTVNLKKTWVNPCSWYCKHKQMLHEVNTKFQTQIVCKPSIDRQYLVFFFNSRLLYRRLRRWWWWNIFFFKAYTRNKRQNNYGLSIKIKMSDLVSNIWGAKSYLGWNYRMTSLACFALTKNISQIKKISVNQCKS